MKVNYNNFMTPDKLSEPINSRAKLDTGTHCQAHCSFCYYKEELDKVTSFEIIRERIDKIYKLGIREIDLSGGESSIHKDWFSILDYCSERFRSVSCLSNGLKFSSLEFTRKSKEHGLSEILFSLHGWDSESHDKIVGVSGAYERILEAIKNCQSLGIMVRLNCTVDEFNAGHMKEYTDTVLRLNPFQINFLPLNYWSDNKEADKADYNILSKGIKRAIDNLTSVDMDTNIEINVRYIPFCEMLGYEKYIVSTVAHIYDQKDWNLNTYDIDNMIPNTIENAYIKARENILNTYYKPRECYQCKFFHICDGYEKQFSDKVIEPILGDKITNPLYFRSPKC